MFPGLDVEMANAIGPDIAKKYGQWKRENTSKDPPDENKKVFSNLCCEGPRDLEKYKSSE